MPETAGPPMSRLEDRSLKAQCVEAIERLIISGDLPVGSAYRGRSSTRPSWLWPQRASSS